MNMVELDFSVEDRIYNEDFGIKIYFTHLSNKKLQKVTIHTRTTRFENDKHGNANHNIVFQGISNDVFTKLGRYNQQTLKWFYIPRNTFARAFKEIMVDIKSYIRSDANIYFEFKKENMKKMEILIWKQI